MIKLFFGNENKNEILITAFWRIIVWQYNKITCITFAHKFPAKIFFVYWEEMPGQSVRRGWTFSLHNLKFTGHLSNDRLLLVGLTPVSFLAKQEIPRVSILDDSLKKRKQKKTCTDGNKNFQFRHYVFTHLQACSSFRFSPLVAMQRMVTFTHWSPPRS